MTATTTTSLDNNELTLEIPVWVHGKRKWVTGITKKTTFDDLIYALLIQADLLKPSDLTNSSSNSITGYAIAECLQSTPSNNIEPDSSVITQRLIKGRSKVSKSYKTWQFDKLPLTILQLISTSSLIDNNSSTTKFRSKIFRRFLSKSPSTIENHTEEVNQQKLLNNFHQNFNILERQKRLLDYLDDKIHQAENVSSNSIVTLNDVSHVLTSKPTQQEQLVLATKLCNSILNIQEHIDEKTTNLSTIEQAISNELNQHYDTLPSLMSSNENTNSSSDLITLKNSIYRSRELSRIQSKEMHDLDLSLREAEILLESKYDELKYLEHETSTPNLNLIKQSNLDEPQIAYETVELHYNSMKEIDEDSGINSLTSDDSNHHSMSMMHHKMNSQLETLV
jgi:hypothetical protein